MSEATEREKYLQTVRAQMLAELIEHLMTERDLDEATARDLGEQLINAPNRPRSET